MIIAYIIAYIASYLASKAGHYILSGIILILMALALYAMDYLRTKSIVNLRGLFALGFVGGEGISCLKLSYLQTDWQNMTWLSFFFAFAMFYIIYELLLINGKRTENRIPLVNKVKNTVCMVDCRKLFICTVVLTCISLLCFTAEACILGYIPLFVKGVPHAYSYFHISGVHYFTVSCVLVPAFCIVWFFVSEGEASVKKIIMLICCAAALAVPLLCVSRFQFVFAIAVAAVTFIVLKKTIPVKIILVALAVSIAAFAVLSIARSHDAEYLNSIFEMKINLPVDISRIYIYIANNYDNFDCMVKNLPAFTMGLKLLFPLFALTGMKFVFPSLVSFPLFVTKEELTTLTLFYDFYYDFGVAGVFIGGAVIGAAARLIEALTFDREDSMITVLYSQFALYMALSFFTTWFSNPTTWFYFAVTLIIYFVSTKRYSAE